MEQTSKSDRRYDAEFNENAVALVKSSLTVVEAARDLGVTTWSLRRRIAANQNGGTLNEPKTPANETLSNMAELFFATLKTERFGSALPRTRAQARLKECEYIETFYNPKRLQSALATNHLWNLKTDSININQQIV